MLGQIESLTDEEILDPEVAAEIESEIEGIGDLAGRRRARTKYRKRRAKAKSRTRKASAKRRKVNSQRKSARERMAAIGATYSKISTSKVKFEAMKNLLPKAARIDLAKRRTQVVDAAIFGVKNLEGLSTIKLFEPADDATVAKTNLNRAQLDLGKHFLLTAIKLEPGFDLEKDADYKVIDWDLTANDVERIKEGTDSNAGTRAAIHKAFANFFNGNFELKVGTQVLVPELPVAQFNHGMKDVPKNTIVLDNPKFIDPQKTIEPQITLPASAKNMFAKVTLIGAWTEKY